MEQKRSVSYLSAGEDYLNDLYDQFLENPDSVSEAWQNYFKSFIDDPLNKKNQNVTADISHKKIQQKFLNVRFNAIPSFKKNQTASAEKVSDKLLNVYQLIQAYRTLGHRQARLDPLALSVLPQMPVLLPAFYNLDASDFSKNFSLPSYMNGETFTLDALIKNLKKTYCHTLGAEYSHIDNPDEIQWLQARLEGPRPVLTPAQKKRLLTCLTAAEGLEKYLGFKYVGQKRFSLEGSDSLIVLLDTLVAYSAQHAVKEIVIGMLHRGRLNVLVNILGKPLEKLFNEFEGKKQEDADTDYSGDVKYHLGFSSDILTSQGSLHLTMGFNPSHLEIISPVINGSVRAKQQRRESHDAAAVMSVQIHGDAAFSGQGVVMETFSLSQTPGHSAQGTLHIVVNNQIGFTTDPLCGRSTPYCTDIAKMIGAPIFHVNADDPETVAFLAQLAVDYRMKFHKDIIIDLIGYRRHGHNESDEPSATQPLMYQKIKKQPSVYKLYADELIQAGIVSASDVSQSAEEYRNNLDKAENSFVSLAASNPDHARLAASWEPYLQPSPTASMLENAKNTMTSVAKTTLEKLGAQINTLPEGMTLQPQVGKMVQDNQKMAQGLMPINWGFAENLAYATLLHEGYAIRLTGQDTERGTFAHRHAVWHDYKNGAVYIPLQHVFSKTSETPKNNFNARPPNNSKINPNFAVINSILSEEAVMAFEYGYSTAAPETLTLWEAQFGDFANGAQVVMDQFISSGEQKWRRLSGLTLLLPHGYEGMGPEHSSARLERFLQLCAQNNMQVCVPTTPSQMFHLLRRQLHQPLRKPLIVITPKSLLRHPLAVSSLDDLAAGYFQTVMDDSAALLPKHTDPKKIKRVLFCCGKIYYDLWNALQKLPAPAPIALLRIEQLYPFDAASIKALLKNYDEASSVLFCQEEPQNQGAWTFVAPRLSDCLQKKQVLRYCGRAEGASPACGSSKEHTKQQQDIIESALLF